LGAPNDFASKLFAFFLVGYCFFELLTATPMMIPKITMTTTATMA
jgi:hypothetical protein